ncbi:normal mucosa of esophagus-specific gene 1 protein [Halyomorpha halys]|uniref:normal mucosa of esophagus-specific gene 1 protein n=1 Tax=Halyomorpha halys TaxID=286706 RepID=UPI0006D4F535|nr:normal mucosa of esophagus-specific gene 1 protein-like [Halyomorpha halys]
MGNSSGIVKVMRGPYPQPIVKNHMKNKEILPLVFLIIGDMIFATAMSTWMYNTRDIVIDRSKKPINEQMDLLKPYALKLLTIDQVWEPAVDLHAAYEAMKEEEDRRKAEKEDS